MDLVGGVERLSGVGKASTCVLYGSHNPVPLRFVWHHILPQSCGGKTTRSNLVSVCDNCHYGIHELLWDLKLNGGMFVQYQNFANTPRAKYAIQGYTAALAMDRIGDIPKQMFQPIGP